MVEAVFRGGTDVTAPVVADLTVAVPLVVRGFVDEVFSPLPVLARAALNPAPRIDAVSCAKSFGVLLGSPEEPEEEEFPLMLKEPSLL
jgi:hypothetical protein